MCVVHSNIVCFYWPDLSVSLLMKLVDMKDNSPSFFESPFLKSDDIGWNNWSSTAILLFMCGTSGCFVGVVVVLFFCKQQVSEHIIRTIEHSCTLISLIR